MTEPNQVEALYLRARRNKITLSSLSNEAGNHPSTLRRWMAGTTSPRLADIKRYEDVLTRMIEKGKK